MTAPVYQAGPSLGSIGEDSLSFTLTLNEEADVHYLLLEGAELSGDEAPNSEQIINEIDAQGRGVDDSGGPLKSGSEMAEAETELAITVDQLPSDTICAFYIVAVDRSANQNAAAVKTLTAATLVAGAPVLTNPRLGALSAETVILIFDLADSDAAAGEMSAIHWLAVPTSETTAPTAAQVADGDTAIGASTALAGQAMVAAQGDDLEATAMNLDGATAYRFYMVAEDGDGKRSALASAGEAPALPAISGSSFTATLAENSREGANVFDLGAELSGAAGTVTYEITEVAVTDMTNGGDDAPAGKFSINADGVIQATVTAIDYDILVDPFTYTLTIGVAASNERGSLSATATLTVTITDKTHDSDSDGLIEIGSLAQLNAMRYDLDGDGSVDSSANQAAYDAADLGSEGCPTEGCNGYELAGDIDLGGSASPWQPIADFRATFEGNGHSLSHLYIRGDSADVDILGLFAVLDGATARNLTLSEVDIQALYTAGGSKSEDNNLIGSLAGLLKGTGLILNVGVSDSDSSIDLQGAATNDSQIIGGLVGYQLAGSIIASSAAVAVSSSGTGIDSVGGLTGWQSNIQSIIVSSFATGAVSGGSGTENIGGLVGLQSVCSSNGRVCATVVSSYATGAVTGSAGDDNVGGLLGAQLGGTVLASFATGSLIADTDDSDVGRLIGNSITPSGTFAHWSSTFTASYGFGAITGGAAKGDGADGNTTSAATAAALTATNAGSDWSSSAWDFGDSAQIPALKFVTGYDRDTGAYSCDSSLLPSGVTCGSLLPGQR